MKVLKWLDENFEEKILVAMLFFTVGMTFIQVVMRYIFKSSLLWSEELNRYLFLYMNWVGAAYAVKKESHLRIEIVKDRVPESKKDIFEIVIYLIWLGFSIFLFYTSLKMTGKNFAMGQLSPAMRIPMAIAYFSIPLGTGLMAFRIIQKILEKRRNIS